MKKHIIILGTSAIMTLGMTALAVDPSNTGHEVEVVPGEWDDENGDKELNFTFKEIPQARFDGLQLTITCDLPGAQILYTTDPQASVDNADAWTIYTAPLSLTADCTVRFFARCEGYKDSEVQSYIFIYADHQAAAPSIAPDMERTHLMMTCETPGAAIRYTTDGTEPNSGSTLYQGPVAIESNGLVRARAFADDMFESAITDYSVDFLTVALPTVAFDNRALVITPASTADVVYYTKDADAAVGSDAWSRYTAPISLTEDCIVRYYGSRSGYHNSEVGAFSFIYSDYQAAPPVLSSDAEGTHVMMECVTPGAEIRYTTDGSEPTSSSALYTAPVEITGNGTFKARSFAAGLFESNVVDFIIMHLAVPAPTASFGNKLLTISCADEKAEILYTTNPDAVADNAEAWTVYTAPLALTENCTVRFFGRRANFNHSDIQSFAFVYSDYRAADPTIERNGEGTHIVMETSTPGAEIRYTMDGSDPTPNSLLYTAPIEIEGNFTFSAIAIADGLFDSKVNRYVVSNVAAPDPFATFENLKMTLYCADSKASIFYTLDADATPENIGAWTLYTEPFSLTGDCTLRFFSRRDNFNDSDIESLTFVYAAYQAPAPAIFRNAQGTHMLMSTATEGGQIRYTDDGSEPTAASALYESPVRISEGVTYKARVFAPNMFDSEVSEYIIGNERLNVPVAAYEKYTLVLSTDESGVQIWYTTNPDLTVDEIDSWTLYENPLPLTADCTYRFFAGDDDANASDVQTFVFQRADWQVAVPTIERDEAGTHIVMETPTEGGLIRYTFDGSEPTEESLLYTGPIAIECNGIYRARAFAEGLFDSEVTDFTVANMATPVAYATFENKLLTLTCSDSEAAIYYTTDTNATPDNMEAWTLYNGPVALTENCTVDFFTRRDNFNDSDIETFVFLRANYMAAAPLIERSEDGRSIIMSTETEGGEIRYTTDGTEPTEESEVYTEPIFITQNGTFRARTYANGLFESAESEYTVANMMMMMPHAAFEDLHVVLSVWDEAASIMYTLDEDALPEDMAAWTLYTEPLALDSDCTVRFFARRGGFLDSQIASFYFIYADYQTAAPFIEFDSEANIVTISCPTEGGEIRYTTDGSEPTEESELYTGPIAVDKAMTVSAKAFAEGLFGSEVVRCEVDPETSGIDSVEAGGEAISVSRQGNTLIVTSNCAVEVPVYNFNGMCVRILSLEAGSNVISDLSRGTYIIAGIKVIF